MESSQVIAIVAVLIVVVVAYILLTNPDILSNLLQLQPPTSVRKYDNNIITIKNKAISDKNPLAGSSTSIEFYISNNGDKTVDYVEVFFSDLPGLSDFNIVKCEGGRIEKIDGVDRKCIFDRNYNCPETNNDCRIESLDARKIRAKLKMQTFDVATPITIRYSVSYTYNGAREMRIPIVSDPSFLPEEVKFDSGKPTYGPIQVEVEPPIGRERVEDKTTIVEHFAYGDTPFNIKFNLKNVGSSSIGTIQPVIIERNNFKMKLENLAIVDCDKVDSTTKQLKENVEGKIPFSISCSLSSTVTNIPTYEIGTIKLVFEYTYKFINTDEFTIRPL